MVTNETPDFSLWDLLFPPMLMLKGVMWVGGALKETALEELTDESKVYEALLSLESRLNDKEISLEEYSKEETKLIERLEMIKQYKDKTI